LFGDTPEAKHYGTAEAVGVLGPYCTAYYIQESPIAFWALNATLEDVSGSSTPIPTQYVQLTNMNNDQHAQTFGFSDDALLYAESTGLYAPSGPIGKNLGGMIVICNAARFSNGTAKETYDVPADMSMTNNDFMSLFTNPWRDIRTNTTKVDTHNINLSPDNNDDTPLSTYPGLVPLPHILKGLPGVPDGSWWYYVSPRDVRTYGDRCGQLGMRDDVFKDLSEAELACNLPKYGCIPGMDNPANIEWTWRQRAYDSDLIYFRDDDGGDDDVGDNVNPTEHLVHARLSHNNGHWERALRDSLRAKTPCAVSSMFQDLLRLPADCGTFEELNNAYRHLPSDWIPGRDSPADASTCRYPQYWMQLSKNMLMKELEQDISQIALRLTVAIPNSVLLSESVRVAAGEFESDTVACYAVQNSREGAIRVDIKNTDPDITGTYIVAGECTEGIVVTTAPVTTTVTLTPQQTTSVTLNVEQSGDVLPPKLGGPDASCTLFLTTPGATAIIMDTLTTNCELTTTFTPFSISDTAALNLTDVCETYNVGCTGQGDPETKNDGNWFWTAVWVTLGFVIALLLLSYCWVNGAILDEARVIKSVQGTR
jgi:hypothetical protein